MPACCFGPVIEALLSSPQLCIVTEWSSTGLHHALDFRDASGFIRQSSCRNLYSDGLTILVTANGHSHLRQRARPRVDVSREAPPVAGMRLWRDDQFKRMSNRLKSGKSEQVLGRRVPMAYRSIAVDPDDGCHSIFLRRSVGGRRRRLHRVHHPVQFPAWRSLVDPGRSSHSDLDLKPSWAEAAVPRFESHSTPPPSTTDRPPRTSRSNGRWRR